MYTLIVNRNGLLSACPTNDDFRTHQFATDGLIVLPAVMEKAVFFDLWQNRDDAYILHPDLPPMDEAKPGRVYYLYAEGRLYRHE